MTTAKRQRKPRVQKAEPVAPTVTKAEAPAASVPMGGRERLGSAMIGGCAPVIGSATIGGAACTLR